MKILRQGKPQIKKENDWAGVDFTCEKCDCQFELDGTEKIAKSKDGISTIKCPNCKNEIKIKA